MGFIANAMFHLSLANIALPNIEARDFIAGTSLLISLFTAAYLTAEKADYQRLAAEMGQLA